MVDSCEESKVPRVKRTTRHDLPVPMSPSRTSLACREGGGERVWETWGRGDMTTSGRNTLRTRTSSVVIDW